jgi:hypothetical protein
LRRRTMLRPTCNFTPFRAKLYIAFGVLECLIRCVRGTRVWLVFGRCSVRIPGGTPAAILTGFAWFSSD